MERLAKLQRSFIFYPDPTPPRSASSYFPRGEDVTLTTEDGVDLGAWWLPPLGSLDRGMAVLYAPGNGGQREGRLHLFALLAERGFSVLAMDYRGYGGNPGTPSEAGLAAVWERFEKKNGKVSTLADIGNYLYRIKEWVNGNKANVLNEHNIQMFKGITRYAKTPYAQF